MKVKVNKMTDDVKLENEEVEKTKIELIPKTSDMDKEFNWFDLIKCEYKINSICYEIYLPASFFKIHEFLSKDINIKDKSIKTGEDIVTSCTVKNISKIQVN